MSTRDDVLTRLRAAVTPVHDGKVPTDAQGRPLDERYAVLYAAPGLRSSEDLGRTADRLTDRWQVTSVGTTPEQVDWVAVRCRDALVDEPFVVGGQQVAPVEHTSSSPVRRDDDIPGGELFYAVDTYALIGTH